MNDVGVLKREIGIERHRMGCIIYDRIYELGQRENCMNEEKEFGFRWINFSIFIWYNFGFFSFFSGLSIGKYLLLLFIINQ